MNLNSLEEYCQLAESATGIPANEIRQYANDSLAYFGSDKEAQAKVKESRTLERDWYASLPNPDYSLYGRKDFLGDLWACWRIYSRRYVQMIRPLFEQHQIQSVVDVGNGIGYSTAYFREVMPSLSVYGTNLPGYQMDVCRKVAQQFGFSMLGDSDSLQVDAIFASEYFEHFERPCAHLSELIQRFSPKMIICANAFGAESFGHFPEYKVDDQVVSNKAVGRQFGKYMKLWGFAKLETGFWNNRPTVYLRAQ